MQILHINTYYIGNPLYSKLYEALAETEIEHQTVFVPVRRITDIGRNAITSDRVSIHYSNILRPWHRLLFHNKLKCSLNELCHISPIETTPKWDIIHAHSLYSDGAIAYRLHQKYGTPYIVAIRNTDVHYFYRFMPHLRGMARQIARHAYGIVFLSPSYKERYLARFVPKQSEPKRPHIHVIPNGIDQAWQRAPQPRIGLRNSVHILFVGAFVENKNVIALIDAVELLQKQGLAVSLRLVGMRDLHRYSARICERASISPHIEIFPHTDKIDDIRMHYQWADVFAMVSFRETFGIVYAEALSQGLPVVYTQGEGFDGWDTDRTCGMAASARDSADIARCIQVAANIAKPEHCIATASQFYWPHIAATYVSLYSTAMLSQ